MLIEEESNILTVDINENLSKVEYEFYEENRYKIVEFKLNNEEYTCICNNGFIKLYSNKCKSYWLCQNETEHTTKDWKFHISVISSDLKKAWNLISKIFIDMKCKSGMKVVYSKENPCNIKGREITIYIIKYENIYDESEIKKCYPFYMSDEHSEDFWIEFIKKCEKLLKENNIRSNGVSHGDLRIGEYISLRNEAYIKVGKHLAYPPDKYGWNARKNILPFDLKKIQKQNYSIENFQSFLYIFLIVLIIHGVYFHSK
jgi:hypothetical protein